MEKIKRYLIFLIGLFINALGVSFITKVNLGTSPISSIPYVLSLKFEFSLGEFTIFFSILLIILQFFILKRNFKLEHLLQIPVSVLFGYFIDFTMLLLSNLNPQKYIFQLIFLVIGCIILGFGVYLEVFANVVMLPGESFVRAIVIKWNRNFGNTKIIFDISMSVIAGIISFFAFYNIYGVREGTVIAAVLVGFTSKFFGRVFSFAESAIFSKESKMLKTVNTDLEEIK